MILISIVGNIDSSILPIFYEFRNKLTHHFLIHDDSKSDTKKVENLFNAQNKFKIENKLKFKLHKISIDEDSFENVLSILHKIEEILGNECDYSNIYLNGTDGLSNISLIIGMRILQKNGKFISYDIFENEYNCLTFSKMDKFKIKYNMDIATHLMLKGYLFDCKISYEELLNRKKYIYKIAENLLEYKKFTTAVKNNGSTNEFEFFNDILKTINKVNDLQFISGGFFEEYIYWLLKDNFEIDDILCCIKIDFEDEVKNEFDVLFIEQNHLHQIECKFVNKLHGEPVVYKTSSSTEHLDDDGKAMILSIGGESKIEIGNKVRKQFSRGDLARARKNDIEIFQRKHFNVSDFLNTIEKFFGLKRK